MVIFQTTYRTLTTHVDIYTATRELGWKVALSRISLDVALLQKPSRYATLNDARHETEGQIKIMNGELYVDAAQSVLDTMLHI